MTSTSTGADLAHTIGAEGIVSIRVRDGDEIFKLPEIGQVALPLLNAIVDITNLMRNASVTIGQTD